MICTYQISGDSLEKIVGCDINRKQFRVQMKQKII